MQCRPSLSCQDIPRSKTCRQCPAASRSDPSCVGAHTKYLFFFIRSLTLPPSFVHFRFLHAQSNLTGPQWRHHSCCPSGILCRGKAHPLLCGFPYCVQSFLFFAPFPISIFRGERKFYTRCGLAQCFEYNFLLQVTMRASGDPLPRYERSA